MLKRWSTKIGAGLGWLIVCGLALIVISTLATLFSLFIVMTIKVNRYSIQIMIQTFYVIMGILWLGFFILMEHLILDRGIRQGMWLNRTLLFSGIELGLIALFSLGIMAYQPVDSSQMILTAVECLLSAGCIYGSRRVKVLKNPDIA